MSEYPKCKYHLEQPAVVVLDEEAEIALGDGWVSTPSELGNKQKIKAEKKGK